MNITISVTVYESSYRYNDANTTSNEVSVTTQAPRPESLPWSELCASLVENSIDEYRAKKADADKETGA